MNKTAPNTAHDTTYKFIVKKILASHNKVYYGGRIIYIEANMKKSLIILTSILTIVGASALAVAQDNAWGEVSPFCLSHDCGDDVTNADITEMIDAWGLDRGAESFSGFKDSHHRPLEEIRKCTAVCYGHFKQSSEACSSIAERSDAMFNSGAVLNTEAVKLCNKAAKDNMYSCLKKCN